MSPALAFRLRVPHGIAALLDSFAGAHPGVELHAWVRHDGEWLRVRPGCCCILPSSVAWKDYGLHGAAAFSSSEIQQAPG